MIIKCNQAFISVAQLKQTDTNNLFTQFASGTVALADMLTALDSLATQVVAISVSQRPWTAPVTIAGNGLSIILDHPFGMNSVVAAISSGSVSTTVMKVATPYGPKTSTRTVSTLVDGSWAITGPCSYLSAKIHQGLHLAQPDIFKTGNRESTYIAATQQIAQEISSMAELSQLATWLPEEVGIVEDGAVYIHRPVELSLISTFATSMKYSELPATVQSTVDAWISQARVTARLDPALAGATDAALNDAFASAGLGYWMNQDLPWLKINPGAVFIETIDPYTVQWLATYSRYCVNMLAYYARWFQAGTFLSDDEVQDMVKQWLILMRKFGVTGDWDMTDQFDSKYDMFEAMLMQIDPNHDCVLNPAIFAGVEAMDGRAALSVVTDTSSLTTAEMSELGVLMSLNRVGFTSWPDSVKAKVSNFTGNVFTYTTAKGTALEVHVTGAAVFRGATSALWASTDAQQKASALYLHVTRLSEIAAALTAVTDLSVIKTAQGDGVVLTASALRWISNLGPYYLPGDSVYIHPSYKL